MNAYFPSIETIYRAILDAKYAFLPAYDFTAEQDGRGGWIVDTFTRDGRHVKSEIAYADYKGGKLVIHY